MIDKNTLRHESLELIADIYAFKRANQRDLTAIERRTLRVLKEWLELENAL